MDRILIINTYHYLGGGDSTYAFRLADLLQSKGHDVSFFAMQDPGNIHDPNSDLFVSPIDFQKLNETKSLSGGLRVLGRSIYSTEAKQKFQNLLDRNNPDVIHLQSLHGHITPSVIFVAKNRGLPVVWTIHDYKLICPNSHFLIDSTGEICEACGSSAYYQAVLKRCKKGSLLASGMAAIEAYTHRMLRVRDQVDFFLAPSRFLRNKLIDRGFDPKKVRHLPLFLPSESFNNSGGHDGYFLYLGKLRELKGLHVLLKACRLAPEIRLILAGPIDERFKDTITSLLPSNALYVGMKHGEELLQLIRRAYTIVLPSLTYENQPYSILEAYASGKPVIASDLGGITELVRRQELGVLVSPGDAEELASAMQWMLTHCDQVAIMGQAAYEYALSHYEPNDHYRKLLDIYCGIRENIDNASRDSGPIFLSLQV